MDTLTLSAVRLVVERAPVIAPLRKEVLHTLSIQLLYIHFLYQYITYTLPYSYLTLTLLPHLPRFLPVAIPLLPQVPLQSSLAQARVQAQTQHWQWC